MAELIFLSNNQHELSNKKSDDWEKKVINFSLSSLFRSFIETFNDVEQKLQDPLIKEMIDKYNHLFLSSGWIVFSHLMHIIIPIAAICLILLNDSNIFVNYWIITTRILFLIGIHFGNKKILQTPLILNNVFPWAIFFFGILTTIENLSYDQPKLLELSIVSYFGMFVIILVGWFQYKKIALMFWLSKLIFIIAMNIRYKWSDTALITLSVAIVIFVYPVLCVLICKIVIEFLLLHDKNKKLVSTIKRILEVFPEGVVIRDSKESQLEKSTLFTNNSAQKNFQLDVNHLDDPSINQAKFIINDAVNLDKIYTLEEVFKYAESRVELNERNDEIWIEILQDKFDSSSSTGSSPRYFTMKTLNVEWESSKNSFMHVFVNISNIKRLEKERATNKCLHIMFASISHEFRTPLNAFTNSLDIIKLNFESLKQLLKNTEFKNDSILKKVESNQMSTEKFTVKAFVVTPLMKCEKFWSLMLLRWFLLTNL